MAHTAEATYPSPIRFDAVIDRRNDFKRRRRIACAPANASRELPEDPTAFIQKNSTQLLPKHVKYMDFLEMAW